MWFCVKEGGSQREGRGAIDLSRGSYISPSLLGRGRMGGTTKLKWRGRYSRVKGGFYSHTQQAGPKYQQGWMYSFTLSIVHCGGWMPLVSPNRRHLLQWHGDLVCQRWLRETKGHTSWVNLSSRQHFIITYLAFFYICFVYTFCTVCTCLSCERFPAHHKFASHKWLSGFLYKNFFVTWCKINASLLHFSHVQNAITFLQLFNINPILHTMWLENHTLTLKSNTAKYYFGEKFSFLPTVLKYCSESRKI
jgi:hypothetical protein